MVDLSLASDAGPFQSGGACFASFPGHWPSVVLDFPAIDTPQIGRVWEAGVGTSQGCQRRQRSGRAPQAAPSSNPPR
jgi:hypothetical protein